MVGSSGARRALQAGDAERAQLAGLDVRQRRRHRREHHRRSGRRAGRSPPARCPCTARESARRRHSSSSSSPARCAWLPAPGDAKLRLPGFCVASASSSLSVRRRHRGVHHQHVLDHRQHRDRREVRRLVGQVREQRRVHRDVADRHDAERVAVGRGLGDLSDADVAGGAGPVLDHHRLAAGSPAALSRRRARAGRSGRPAGRARSCGSASPDRPAPRPAAAAVATQQQEPERLLHHQSSSNGRECCTAAGRDRREDAS